MIRIFTLVFIWFWFLVPAKSQTFVWALSDTAQNSDGAGVIRDLRGNLYTASTFTYQSSNMNEASGVYVVKYNKNHNVLWKTKIQSRLPKYPGLEVDNSGNVLLTGWFWSNLLVNGSLCGTTTGGGMFVLKLDSMGQFVWMRSSSGGSSWGTSVSSDMQNNVYVSGGFNGNVIFDTTHVSSPSIVYDYIAKYSSTGKFLWVKYGSQNSFSGWGGKAQTDTSGNTYLVGTFSGTVKFGNALSLTTYGSSDQDMFIAKIDSAGNWLWVAHGGGTAQDAATNLSFDRKGNIYVTGFISSSTAVFGTYTLTTVGASDYFIAKYNPSGAVSLAINGGGAGSQSANDICVDRNGFIYLGSNTKFINVYDSLGNYLWWQQVTASNTNMAADSNGVYIIGTYQGSVTIGNTYLNGNPYGYDQMYVTYLQYQRQASSAIKNVVKPINRLLVYPNPTSGVINLSFCSDKNSDCLFSIRNVDGQEVFKQQVKLENGSAEKSIDIGTLPKGVYFAEVIQGNEHFIRQVVLH